MEDRVKAQEDSVTPRSADSTGLLDWSNRYGVFIILSCFFVLGAYLFATLEIEKKESALAASHRLEVQLSAERMAQALKEPVELLRGLREQNLLSPQANSRDLRVSRLETVLQVLLSKNAYFNQIRWIDATGQEKIRIERRNGRLFSVPDSELQNKSGRYYVQETLQLAAGQTYISPIDFNTEYGVFELPLRPTFRVAMPLDNLLGFRDGIVVINSDVNQLLKRIRIPQDTGRVFLVDEEGKPLQGVTSLGSGTLFDVSAMTSQAAIWGLMRRAEHGTLRQDTGIWVWSTVDIGSREGTVFDLGRLKLLGHIPNRDLAIVHRQVWNQVIPPLLLLMVLMWVLGIRMQRSRQLALITQLRLKESERLRCLEARVSNAESQAKALVDSNINGILVVDKTGTILMSNPALDSMFGYRAGELEGHPIDFLIPKPFRIDHRKLFDKFMSKPSQGRVRSGQVLQGLRQDKSLFPVEIWLSPLKDVDGVRVTATVIDVTERMRSEAEMRQMASVFESTAEAIVITDHESRIINVNQAFVEITGYTLDDVKGLFPSVFQSGRHTPEFYRKLERTVLADGHWSGEHTGRRKDGSIYPEWLTVSRVTNRGGETTYFVRVFSDISRIKKSEREIERLAHKDTLTGLANRSMFYQHLDHAVLQAKRRDTMLAVILLDLDNFKHINDALGFELGDELLQEVATELKKTFRKEDTLARMGGDEFVVLLESIGSPDQAKLLADEILRRLENPFTIRDVEIRVTSSLGIAIFPDDGENSATLLKNADTALHRAKEDGRNRFHFYTEALTERSIERINLENSMRHSLQNEGFYLVYQPQIRFSDGGLVGVEALVRWKHPVLGMISPARFIPFAEESGLIIPLERWIFRQACAQASDWLDRGVPFGCMAINLSGSSIHEGGVPGIMAQVLEETGCPATCIEMEVSEGFIMKRAASAIEQLQELKAMGMTLSIDDFGTGHSSLVYLKQLPIDKLKIDQTFVRNLTSDANDRALASTVIAMGQKLNLSIIAEGVETEAQADILIREGCEEAQGYLYSKPIEAAEFEAFIEHYKATEAEPDNLIRFHPKQK